MAMALSITIPLVLAAVLISSAVAKFRTPDDLAGWRELGVPAVFRREWLRRIHPWGELLLGLALALVGGWLGLTAALVAVALMVGYTVLFARVVSRAESTSCACFGTRKRVTRMTLVRNVWLTLLAVATAAVIWTTPLFGGALAAGIPDLAWLVALAIAAVTTALVLWPDEPPPPVDRAPAPAARAETPDEDGLLDYIRARTPAVPVTLADGTVVNLRTLAARKPILLLAVSSMCGPCESVVARRAEWRELLPEVDVRLLMAEQVGLSAWTEREEPQSLHDLEDYVAESIGYRGTPTAVLLGADGMLAAGPVTGDLGVARLVDDIYESLHGERAAREHSAN
jgi:hypothetical protein